MRHKSVTKIMLVIAIALSAIILTVREKMRTKDAATLAPGQTASVVPSPPEQGTIGRIAQSAIQPDGSLVFHIADAEVIQPPFTLAQDAEAARGNCIEVPPLAGKDEGLVLLAVSIPQKGSYSVFLRAFWGTDGEKGCSNSITIVLDDRLPIIVEDATYEHWHWVPVYAGTDRQNGIELDAGTHVFRFQNREDGIRLDQIFITPWHKDEFQRRVPQGIE